MTSQDRSAHLNNTSAGVVATGDNANINVTIQHGQPAPSVTPPPEPSRSPRIDITSLPNTSPLLLGREAELADLDAAWLDEGIHMVTVVAWGGVGKSALVNAWVAGLCGENDCRGAGRIFGWSFYSQGAAEGRQASAEPFIDAALRWFGDPDPAQGAATEKGRRLAELVRREKTLLVLDGLEPVQHPPGPVGGKAQG